MKRELFENVKVIPGGIGVAVDRTGFLSAVLGVSAKEADTLKIKVEHADTADDTFVALDDPFAGVTGALQDVTVEAGENVNICIDLIGCKDYVRIGVDGSAEGQTVSSALILGDPAAAPV